MKQEPDFLWIDKSGRGETGQFFRSSLQDFDDEDINYDGTPLEEWLDEAEIGEEWENESQKYIRIS